MTEVTAPSWLRPDWPAPAGVRAVFTLRGGGVSRGRYAALNLGQHVGDDPLAVAENRRRVAGALQLPAEPLWLSQVHGTTVLNADTTPGGHPTPGGHATPPADAALTRVPGRVLAVLVADCMPVLLAARDGSAVAVAHAGWRGLAAGVLEATVAALGIAAEELHAWLGPAIGPAHFEVGEEVRAAFCEPGGERSGERDAEQRGEAAAAFVRNDRGRWQCDLRLLARQRLMQLGVRSIHGEPRCTYAEVDAFYSFRRDGNTGRMAALIWLGGKRKPSA